MKKFAILFSALCVIALTTNVWATPTQLTGNRHIFVHMQNGALYSGDDIAVYSGSTDSDAYYIKADGGGLNQLHITTDLSNINGQNTTTNNTSGSFWVTTTGGRGYNDDIVLVLSVKGSIDPNFSVNVKSSGYSWYPGDGSANYQQNPANVSNPGTYATNAVNQTFYASDFSSATAYGSNPYKPGPGTGWTLPLFTGQSDFVSNETLLFIDLKRNNQTDTGNPSLTDKGAVKVEYSFSNMNTSASFNAYSWCLYSNQQQGINWTQNTSGSSGTSSFTVTP